MTERVGALTGQQRLSTLLLVLVTTAGATFTILVAGGAGPQALPVRVAYDAMAAIALIPWLVVAAFRPSWRPSTRLLPAMVAIIAVFAISTVTSRIPRLSVEMLGYVILLLEVYLLLVTLMRRPEIRAHFERLALLLCVLVCSLYLVQVLLAWVDWWGLVGRLTIPPLRPGYLGLNLGSPNPIATLVLILGAFAMATIGLQGRAGRVAGALVAALVAIATFLTGSRGAWLGVGVGLIATFAVAVLLQPEVRGRAMRVTRSRRGVASLALGVPVLAAAGILAALSGRLTLEDNGYRAGFARASLQMFESSPLTGVGPGTWGVLRASNTSPMDPDLYIPHAHNVFLQTFAELGLAGVAAGVVVVAALAMLIIQSIRSGEGARRRVAYAGLFGVVLLAVQQVADVLVNVPALLLAIAMPMAWLDAKAQYAAGTRELKRIRVAPFLMAALVTCAILLGLARIESIANAASQGASKADDGSWHDAAKLFEDATEADPGVNAYEFQFGVAAANSGDLRLAEVSLTKSASADDYAYAWLDLAAVRWRLGDITGARGALVRAERIGLHRVPLAIAAGWLHQQLGDSDTATADYAVAFLQAPSLAADPFWSSSSGPVGGLPAILTSTAGDPVANLQIDLALDRQDLAQKQVEVLSPSDPELYENILPAWRGDPTSWVRLQTAAAQRPLDPGPVAWCRLIASHLGDESAVQKYSSWLALLSAENNFLPISAKIVFGSPRPVPPFFLDDYGSLYRRRVLAAQVIGILPQVQWQYRQ